ncbi:MAG: hypothetical protein LBP40_05245 [Campylobacteraceae bacterium]|jgi:uncharacterized membrane protein YvlD (DUF360 family)|nr:hypothetical protein [Campylobacteraceae bacterium]
MKLSKILFFLFVIVSMSLLNTLLNAYVPESPGDYTNSIIRGFYTGLYIAIIFTLHEFIIKKELKQASEKKD